MKTEVYGIIPARFASSRFPGKPLAKILDRPMFWHVYQKAKQCPEISHTVLATDDEKIIAAAKELSVPVIKTRSDHPSGTDRVLEAALALGVSKNSVVLNIQGDEPLLDPQCLSQLIHPFSSPDVQVATLARNAASEEIDNPDCVKVLISKTNRAIYFSRAMIPYYRGEMPKSYLAHIGLYAYRMRSLQAFVKLGPSRLEKSEKLEQLRLIENDIPIQVVITSHRSIGVDRPGDIAMVESILTKRSKP